MPFTLGKSTYTIPTGACAVRDGNFMELTLAELACTSDLSCIAAVDDGCDGQSPFHLCRELEDTSGENMLRCSTYQEKEGMKCCQLFMLLVSISEYLVYCSLHNRFRK